MQQKESGEDLKLAAELLNSKTSIKCFRHQFQPTNRYCRLCEAKKEANGNYYYARQIFIKSDRNY
jgi:hypothetical protein